MRRIKQYMAGVLAAALTALLLSGCGTTSPEGLSIRLDGEVIETLELYNGTQQSGLTAIPVPEAYTGTVTWSSEDSGIVKLTPGEGNSCTLTAKKTGSTKITAECDGVTATLRVHVLVDPEHLTLRDAALAVNGTYYSLAECNLYFAQTYYDFSTDYADTASYYGLDLSGGIETLAQQSCSYTTDGSGSWKDYFLESAEQQIAQVQALCDYAAENEITLTETQQAEVEEKVAALAREAETAGYENTETYLTDRYGEGVTEDLYRTFLEENALAESVYNDYADGLEFSQEELDAHYATMGYEDGANAYHVTEMRHILILAEADENGEYSEEAIAAAHARAEELYTQWQAGEQTEETFAELAGTYSEDSGSNTNGGLYEDIYNGEMVDGINTWLFTDGRTAGDTAVIDNNGSYVGTHIVYFVGYGALYQDLLAQADLKTTALSDWFAEVTADYTPTRGGQYASIGTIA